MMTIGKALQVKRVDLTQQRRGWWCEDKEKGLHVFVQPLMMLDGGSVVVFVTWMLASSVFHICSCGWAMARFFRVSMMLIVGWMNDQMDGWIERVSL